MYINGMAQCGSLTRIPHSLLLSSSTQYNLHFSHSKLMALSHREKRRYEVKGRWEAVHSSTYKPDGSTSTCTNLPPVSEWRAFSQANPSSIARLRNPSLTCIFSPPFPISSAHTHAQISPIWIKFSPVNVPQRAVCIRCLYFFISHWLLPASDVNCSLLS